jgi:hypothetical protein
MGKKRKEREGRGMRLKGWESNKGEKREGDKDKKGMQERKD